MLTRMLWRHDAVRRLAKHGEKKKKKNTMTCSERGVVGWGWVRWDGMGWDGMGSDGVESDRVGWGKVG